MALPRFNPKTGEMTELSSPAICDFVITTGMLVAATVLSAAVSAYGAIQQGKAQQQSLNYQAAVARQRADRERQEAAARETDFRRQQSRAEARRRALGGVSGVEQTEGSPLLAAEDFTSEVELASLRIRGGGEVNATRLEQSASLSQFQGRSAAQAGFVRGGALLVGGARKAFGTSAAAGPSTSGFANFDIGT